MPSAIVIGAGPAGSTAATLLARVRWHVTLIEQHPFPRDKVCGECLSHLGFGVVTRLGLGPAIRHAGAIALNRTWLHAPDGSSAAIDLPDPMWGLSRRALDSILLADAVRSGTRLIQPARVEAVSNHPPAVTIRDLTTNAIRDERADWILLADGRGSLLPNRPTATGELGIKAHFESVDSSRDIIELFGLHGHYLGLAAIEGNRTNVAYAVPARRLRECRGNLDSLFAQLRDENPTLDAKFRPARQVSEWLASPLPRFPVTSDWPAGIVPLGNAAAAVEPIGGEGMGLALRSAEMAAQSLIAAGTDSNHPSLRNLPAEYRRLWRTRRPACRAGAVVMSRPRLAATAIDLLRLVPGLAGPSLRWVGK